jgi:hypothetical protein
MQLVQRVDAFRQKWLHARTFSHRPSDGSQILLLSWCISVLGGRHERVNAKNFMETEPGVNLS